MLLSLGLVRTNQTACDSVIRIKIQIPDSLLEKFLIDYANLINSLQQKNPQRPS